MRRVCHMPTVSSQPTHLPGFLWRGLKGGSCSKHQGLPMSLSSIIHLSIYLSIYLLSIIYHLSTAAWSTPSRRWARASALADLRAQQWTPRQTLKPKRGSDCPRPLPLRQPRPTGSGLPSRFPCGPGGVQRHRRPPPHPWPTEALQRISEGRERGQAACALLVTRPSGRDTATQLFKLAAGRLSCVSREGRAAAPLCVGRGDSRQETVAAAAAPLAACSKRLRVVATLGRRCSRTPALQVSELQGGRRVAPHCGVSGRLLGHPPSGPSERGH